MIDFIVYFVLWLAIILGIKFLYEVMVYDYSKYKYKKDQDKKDKEDKSEDEESRKNWTISLEVVGKVWKENCPDFRFSQLIINVLNRIGPMAFYMEEPELLQTIEDYFKGKENRNNKKRKVSKKLWIEEFVQFRIIKNKFKKERK